MNMWERSHHNAGDDSEERREAFAKTYGMDADTSWGWILKKMRDSEEGELASIGLDEADNRRLELALRYGKWPTASWDELYKVWESKWKPPEIVTPFILIGALAALVVLGLSPHWVAIALLVIILEVIWVFLWLSRLSKLIVLDQHYWGFIQEYPEIRTRAEDAGIFKNLETVQN